MIALPQNLRLSKCASNTWHLQAQCDLAPRKIRASSRKEELELCLHPAGHERMPTVYNDRTDFAHGHGIASEFSFKGFGLEESELECCDKIQWLSWSVLDA